MKGTIRRLVLKNFMCYSYIDFRPGENINVIIAPNGSGKSSLIAGIMLGCASHLDEIGRGEKIESFIKSGCSAAEITLELNNEAGKGPIVIVRQILLGKGSRWQLNGAKVAKANVYKMYRKFWKYSGLSPTLTIDVRWFPDPILFNTNRAPGNICISRAKRKECRKNFAQCFQERPNDLAVYHKELKELSKNENVLSTDISALTKKVDDLTEENRRMEVDIQTIRQRDELCKKIDKLKIDYAWKEYQQHFTIVKKLERKETEVEAEVKKLQAVRQRERNRIDKLRKQARALKTQVRLKEQQLLSKKEELAMLLRQSEEQKRAIEATHEVREEELHNEKVREDELERHRVYLKKLMGDMASLSISQEEQKKRLEEFNAELRKETALRTNAQQKEAGLQFQLQNLSSEIKAKEAAVRKLRDKAAMRLQVLQSQFPDAYQAFEWLKENRHMFKRNIYGPMLLEMELADPGSANFVEAAIPVRDLVAFTCEDMQDMNRFLDIMRNQRKLRINIVHSGPEHPPSASYQPTVPMRDLKRFGFETFIRDMFTAPEPIMKYLCRSFAIHRIPVGTNMVDDKFEEVPVPLFFSAEKRYSVKRSAYSGDRLTSINDVRGARLLKKSDYQELLVMEQSLGQLQANQEELKKNVMEAKEHVRAIDHRIENLRTEKRNIEGASDVRRVLQSRINSKKAQIEELKRAKIDIEATDGHYKQKIKAILEKLVNLHEQMATRTECLGVLAAEIERLRLVESEASDSALQAETDAQEILNNFTEQERILKEIKEEKPSLVEKAKRLHKKALSLSGTMPKLEFFEQGSLEELAQQIQQLQAQVDFLVVGSDDAFERYEAQKKQLAELNGRLKDLKDQHKKKYEGREKKHNLWLSRLEETVGKINANFMRCFSMLDCCGEVLLSKPADPSAYDQYGIIIKVKFRDADLLVELNQHTQSGGERSVATALYMIALQQLTCVPFRIVDEINQGMDPVNERKVFEMMVQATQESSSTQYFLLSPKLLPEPHYLEKVTVMVIYTNMHDDRIWDFGDVAKKLEESERKNKK